MSLLIIWIHHPVFLYQAHKFCSKCNTPLRKTSESWLGDFKWRRIHQEKNQTNSKDNEQLLQQLQTGPSCSSASLYSLDWHCHLLTWTVCEGEGEARANSESLYFSFTAYSPSCKCIVETIDLFSNDTFPSLSPSDVSLPSKLWTHLPLLVNGTAVVIFLLPLLVYYTWSYSIFDFITKGRY